VKAKDLIGKMKNLFEQFPASYQEFSVYDQVRVRMVLIFLAVFQVS